MKKNINLMIIAAIAVIIASCKKNSNVPPSSVASVNVVNATAGVAPLFVKNNNIQLVYSSVSSTNKLNYGANFVTSPVAGSNTYTFVQSTDTLQTFYKASVDVELGNIYTLFLTGTVSQPDMVLIHEQLQYYAPPDSVASIRFINLSANSNPVSVDIQGQANGSEAQSLPYKSYSSFKTYAANHTISSYTFEFRDAASGSLLATYKLSGVNNATGTNTTANTVRFHNMTIALIGEPIGGTVAQSAILVADY